MKSARITSTARIFALLLPFVAAACTDDPVAPTSAVAAVVFDAEPSRAMPSIDITAVSRNVYIGIDADFVIAALANGDPADDLPALLLAIETLQKTAFPARARALAAEIAKARPHFVGLQEISDINIQIPPLGVSIALDFLAILQAELVALGLDYEVAARIENSVVTLTPIPGSSISVRDFDVILVDSRRVSLDAGSVIARNFAANIGPVAPGITIVRGFVAITAQVRGQTIVVANTHLESGDSPLLGGLRAAQVQELLASIHTEHPTILLGDFNDSENSLMYDAVAAAGFVDTWRSFNAGADGFTCCHLADLSNESANALNRRLDYIFVRGAAMAHDRLVGRAHLVGEESGDRVPGPAHDIWPSDHAGVVARVRYPAVPAIVGCENRSEVAALRHC